MANKKTEPKNWPQPFEQSETERKQGMKEAAAVLAQYLSPKFVLSDPHDGEELARGERAEIGLQNET